MTTMLTKITNQNLSDKTLNRLQFVIITIFCSVPLFVELPFKINLYLAWEGAYRFSIGQIPFRDFSLPMGFCFWVIPGMFFKLFGPSLYSLIIAQSTINFLGAFSLKGILQKLGLSSVQVTLSILVYCLSFVFVNFWPWYNHSVFIFQLVATNFLLSHIETQTKFKKHIYLFFAAFFVVVAIFTKQDGGGLALVSVSILMMYVALAERAYKWLGFYSLYVILVTLIFILPFLQYDFIYWFNYGQAPHNARTSINDILIDVFEGSQWLKFYLLVWVIIVLKKLNANPHYLRNRREILLNLFVLSILAQAFLVQVTSYIPHNVNIYFHSIALAFIFYHLLTPVFSKPVFFAAILACITFWWSADYWRYGQRILNRVFPNQAQTANTNKISKYTWLLPDSTASKKKEIKWVKSSYPTFYHVLLPEETVAGIDSIMKLPVLRKKELQVLNMSELTPLAHEIGYEPLRQHPLWFHRNVAIFDPQIDQLCRNIASKDYDLVLFEEIPYLNQFYPEKVRSYLQTHYRKVLTFIAPREKEGAFIEVYVQP